MQPYLFVGVGGTGGKTLRYLWREMDRRLKANGWTRDDMPQCFGFLHIDLPTTYDGNTEADIPIIPALETRMYYGLGEAEVPYSFYDEKLTRGGRIEGLLPWRPYDPKRIPAPGKGAGQRRAVGRVVSVYNLADIGDRLKIAMDAVEGGAAANDLLDLRGKMPNGTFFEGDGHVVVIGSLAGGSGSGIFLDVLEAIRQAPTGFAGHIDPFAVLIAPDVFQGIGGPDSGVFPNALAAMAEMLNGTEATGDLPAAEAALRAGPLSNVVGQRIGHTNFMIGRSNGEVSFDSPGAVYESVGRMLAAVALDPRHQAPLDQYILTNAAVTAVEPVVVGDREVPGVLGEHGAFSSAGYSLVGMGRHLFARYAAERLARRAYERLLAGHDERDVDLSSDVRLARLADQRWAGGFLTATGLNELGPDANQVIDQLRDDASLRARIKTAKDSYLQVIRARTSNFVGKEWTTAHEGAFDRAFKGFHEAEVARRSERAKAWAVQIQDQVEAAVVDEVSNYGLPLAIRLVERLASELDDTVKDLEKEAEDLTTEGGKFKVRAKDLLDGVLHKLKSGADEHDKSASFRSSAAFNALEASTRALAAELVADVRDNLVPSIKSALTALLDRLNTAKEEESTKRQIQRWSESVVPKHLLPASNERLVEPAAGFPAMLEALLTRQMGGQSRDAINAAVREIISGVWPSVTPAQQSQTLLRNDGSWFPAAGANEWGGEPGARAQIAADLVPERLPDRVEAWLQNRQGNVREHLQKSLRQFLFDDDNAARNQSAFMREIKLALAKSRPFVDIDSTASKQLHGDNGDETYVSVSTIPVAPGEPLHDQLLQAFAAAKVEVNTISFDGASRVTEIDIIRYPTIKFHPAALRSVTGPISDNWAACQSREALRTEFWNNRRSRTMEAYLPISRLIQERLVGGYFVAVLLGYLDLPAQQSWSAKPRDLWSPDGALPLPRRLLTPHGREPSKAAHVLPALLESMPLTWLSAFQANSSLQAYARFVDLGTVEDGDCHPELAEWILTGKRVSGTRPQPAKVIITTPAKAGAKERRDAVVAFFDTKVTDLAKRESVPLKSTTKPRDYDGAREITGLITAALEAISDALPVGDGNDDGDLI